jgi:hypothetical protein
MSKPKPVDKGPHVGQSRLFCMVCGHIVYIATVPNAAPELAPEQRKQNVAAKPAAPMQSGAATMVFRNGSWEIV